MPRLCAVMLLVFGACGYRALPLTGDPVDALVADAGAPESVLSPGCYFESRTDAGFTVICEADAGRPQPRIAPPPTPCTHCGNAGCSKCEPGESCYAYYQCTSQRCVDGICTVPTCYDGVDNQGEWLVDCGGPCLPCADPSCPLGEPSRTYSALLREFGIFFGFVYFERTTVAGRTTGSGYNLGGGTSQVSWPFTRAELAVSGGCAFFWEIGFGIGSAQLGPYRPSDAISISQSGRVVTFYKYAYSSVAFRDWTLWFVDPTSFVY